MTSTAGVTSGEHALDLDGLGRTQSGWLHGAHDDGGSYGVRAVTIVDVIIEGKLDDASVKTSLINGMVGKVLRG
jgi:hypothetical protein